MCTQESLQVWRSQERPPLEEEEIADLKYADAHELKAKDHTRPGILKCGSQSSYISTTWKLSNAGSQPHSKPT